MVVRDRVCLELVDWVVVSWLLWEEAEGGCTAAAGEPLPAMATGDMSGGCARAERG